MKIFNSEDIRAIDRRTIEAEGVTAGELIERAAAGIAAEIAARWKPSVPLTVFAGSGNNGADALSAARLLYAQGFAPRVYLFNIGGNRLSTECRVARDKLVMECPDITFQEVTGHFSTPELNENSLVVDGLFGSGLRGQLTGGFLVLVRYINESGATVVSVDVPSGMNGDLTSDAVNRNIIHATLTLAMQFPRPAFFMRECSELVGEWKVIDIGLSPDAIRTTPTVFHLIEASEIRPLLKPRNPFCSKADFGSALLVAGSYGMMGAAVLAARSALRAGAGKVTVHSPMCGYEVIQSSVPEVLFDADSHKLVVSDMKPRREYSAIGIGCGIGTHDITVVALTDFLQSVNRPVILDADALNIIAANPQLLANVPVLSVLTPHAHEFDRLFGDCQTDQARLLRAIEVSHYHNILILLKGRYTALVRPDGKVYFNSTGCPGMATAGSGDVLTGVITSLMAQGFKPEISAMLGAFIHGAAGELAQENQGEYGVTAGDIAANVGKAIKLIMRK